LVFGRGRKHKKYFINLHLVTDFDLMLLFLVTFRLAFESISDTPSAATAVRDSFVASDAFSTVGSVSVPLRVAFERFSESVENRVLLMLLELMELIETLRLLFHVSFKSGRVLSLLLPPLSFEVSVLIFRSCRRSKVKERERGRILHESSIARLNENIVLTASFVH
jgi:hypothetical protein